MLSVKVVLLLRSAMPCHNTPIGTPLFSVKSFLIGATGSTMICVTGVASTGLAPREAQPESRVKDRAQSKAVTARPPVKPLWCVFIFDSLTKVKCEVFSSTTSSVNLSGYSCAFEFRGNKIGQF